LQKEKEEEERRKLRDERKAAKERKKQENRLKYQSQQMEEEDKSFNDIKIIVTYAYSIIMIYRLPLTESLIMPEQYCCPKGSL
jgi:hypothetical protein